MPDHPSPGAPRLLIPITIHFAVRYVVRTGLADRLRGSCTPVLALSWDDPALAAELRGQGFEVLRLPDARVDPVIEGLGQALEVGFARRLASPSTAIDRRRRYVDRSAEIRLRRWLAWQRDQRRWGSADAEARARAQLERELPDRTNLAEHDDFLAANRIDAVLSVTPFTVQELVLLHAVGRRGLPAATSILSFDNLTTRPPLPIVFDRYAVWNRFNADELRRGYPEVDPARIAVVGPAQFDFYRDPSYVVPAEQWRARHGIAAGAPTLLYGAGPPSVSPHEDQYVEDLLAAIDAHQVPRNLRVVLRRHPNDRPDRWERFRHHPAIAVDDPGAIGDDHRPGNANLDRAQIVDLCSALAHTDVHVSVSSTMSLDGAFFDKPQIGPAYDRRGARRHRRRAIELYEREHFVPLVASGGLELAHSPGQLAAQVDLALADPERLAPQRTAMLTAICTHLDGRCTERVAAEVEAFLADQISS